MDYLELYNLVHTDGDLSRRIEVALLVAAGRLLADASTAPGRAAWARAVLATPLTEAARVRTLVLLDPKLQEAGESAPDDVVQAAVDALLPLFADE